MTNPEGRKLLDLAQLIKYKKFKNVIYRCDCDSQTASLIESFGTHIIEDFSNLWKFVYR